MPRLHGVRERRHQDFWDTLIRTDSQPDPLIQARNCLFGNANVGRSLALTNLQVPGQFASDQTFVVLAIRVCALFRGAADCAPPVEGASNVDISNGFI